jgi:hypothetical protein
MDPITGEISYQDPQDCPRYRVETSYYADAQKGESRAQKAEQRSQEQDLVQSTMVVKPVGEVLQKPSAAISFGRSARGSLEQVNEEIEEDRKLQPVQGATGNLAQGADEKFRDVMPRHGMYRCHVYTAGVRLVNGEASSCVFGEPTKSKILFYGSR